MRKLIHHKLLKSRLFMYPAWATGIEDIKLFQMVKWEVFFSSDLGRCIQCNRMFSYKLLSESQITTDYTDGTPACRRQGFFLITRNLTTYFRTR
ncbi:hypothetical protein ACFCT7_13630 [Fulvivirgaceae bacterium LMO-SS25]